MEVWIKPLQPNPVDGPALGLPPRDDPRCTDVGPRLAQWTGALKGQDTLALLGMLCRASRKAHVVERADALSDVGLQRLFTKGAAPNVARWVEGAVVLRPAQLTGGVQDAFLQVEQNVAPAVVQLRVERGVVTMTDVAYAVRFIE